MSSRSSPGSSRHGGLRAQRTSRRLGVEPGHVTCGREVGCPINGAERAARTGTGPTWTTFWDGFGRGDTTGSAVEDLVRGRRPWGGSAAASRARCIRRDRRHRQEPSWTVVRGRVGHALRRRDELVVPTLFGFEVSGALARRGEPADRIRDLRRTPHVGPPPGDPVRSRRRAPRRRCRDRRGSPRGHAVYVWLASARGLPLRT